MRVLFSKQPREHPQPGDGQCECLVYVAHDTGNRAALLPLEPSERSGLSGRFARVSAAAHVIYSYRPSVDQEQAGLCALRLVSLE
jgi:hypothetical protein